MNIATNINKSSSDRLPYDKKQNLLLSANRSATLSTDELKRIVAAMLG